MTASSKSVRAPDFNHKLKVSETSFNLKVRNHLCQFLKNVHVDFLVVVGPVVRIVTALNCLNKHIEKLKEIDKYLGHQNQTRLSADQITSLDEELNNLLVCEVPTVVSEECKNELMKIITRMETNRRQKAIFVNSEKTTLEKYPKTLGRGALLHIYEKKSDANLVMYPDHKIALYQASSAGKIEKVAKLLADGVKVNSRIRNANNRTALHAAVENGHKNVVLLLLAYGANVRIRDNDQQQPIDLAIKNDNDNILRDIFKIDEKGMYGETRLHVAARSGETETAKKLVKFGANINALNRYDFTPLCLAACYGHYETVRTLADLGADLNILCHEKTALDIANMKKSKIVDYLIWKGAKTSQQMKSDKFVIEIL